ncbi:bifunctional phosphoribosyl-AMP cyclohydrolase/phosphoribosyl-ATP diphosphatase HisIE [bacterium 1xD8-48]|jgi:phosphoribosyl-ATP pyrophosphohydrolase/phosphoribosyl-AMP cyclohydrolase|nr:bifunctional phosphoribosyl-AMP cyclohydrolase/phosphoribosyl-ATP diphosphatase HisIE [Lachnospiraceae bacterium]MCI9325559.1 bifunctional phosphoribosyl-AMP cyclohydrolase/phosphoribosyl-ATP diphosphatase HisIE [Lachnospiraceae bacterium]NBJ99720.1 bifunctional phosphoribosyl-AMP cyclohydrolase/phosphoribosyl-ATP diphosphatase HisIE [bacterium 1xD8-48]
MNNYKKFIPCIYLLNEKAVAGLKNTSVISENPAELARFYAENNADELIVFDLSTDDASHEASLDMLKIICKEAQIPVIGAGNVRRMEDIKKLLYAGCMKAALNYSKESNIAITEEVSLKFGKDKIVACVMDDSDITGNEAVLEEFVHSVILLNERTIKQAVSLSRRPLIVSLPEVSLDKIIELLSCENIEGITGPAVNANARELMDIKDLCAGNGVAVRTFEPVVKWDELKKNSDGLVPVIVQDYKTREVLMMAYMNEEAYLSTLKSGRMTYYSRSRACQWLKGETSGHFQHVKEMTADCDKDTILARVSQIGAACHTGNYSCFFNEIMKKEYDESNPLMIFESVLNVIKDRKVHPREGSYTNYLFDKGIDKILKKLGEEATEIVIAAKNPNANEIKYEIADFLYHMMVLMVEKGVTWEEITEELDKR